MQLIRRFHITSTLRSIPQLLLWLTIRVCGGDGKLNHQQNN